jgi:hypothetical protein
VVKADAERTRLAEISSISSMPNQEIVSKIEKLLTFYTKKSGTTYKQGYNELVGPFLWLAYKNSSKNDPLYTNNPLTLSYHALDLFIRNFMPTIFLDDDFICL